MPESSGNSAREGEMDISISVASLGAFLYTAKCMPDTVHTYWLLGHLTLHVLRLSCIVHSERMKHKLMYI